MGRASPPAAGPAAGMGAGRGQPAPSGDDNGPDLEGGRGEGNRVHQARRGGPPFARRERPAARGPPRPDDADWRGRSTASDIRLTTPSTSRRAEQVTTPP